MLAFCTGALGYVAHVYEYPKCSFIQTSVEKDQLALRDGEIKSELKPATRSMQKYFNAYVATGVAILVVACAILG